MRLDWGNAVWFGLLIHHEAGFVSVAFIDRREFDRSADRIHCSFEVAGIGLGGRQRVEVDGVIIAAQLDYSLSPLDCQVRVANRLVRAGGQQPSRTTLGLRRLRIDFDGSVVFGGCLGISADVGQKISSTSGRIGVGRCELHGGIVVRDGIIHMAHELANTAATTVGDRQIRIELDGVVVVVLCSLQIVGDHEQGGAIRICLRELRIELDRSREVIEGLLELASLSGQHAAIVQSARQQVGSASNASSKSRIACWSCPASAFN